MGAKHCFMKCWWMKLVQVVGFMLFKASNWCVSLTVFVPAGVGCTTRRSSDTDTDTPQLSDRYAVSIGMSRHWYFPAVSIGTHDYFIQIFPPSPLLPIFTLCLHRYLYFCLICWLVYSDQSPSSHILWGEYIFFVCSSVLSFYSGYS